MEYNQSSEGTLGTSAKLHYCWTVFSERTWGCCHLIGLNGQSRY